MILHAVTVIVAVLLPAALVAEVKGNSDGDALLKFKQGLTNYPQNLFGSWNPTAPNPCRWSHVGCDSASRVTRLGLVEVFFVGRISTGA
ncbi:Leucine-rich repeat protein 1 [Linum perenne]